MLNTISFVRQDLAFTKIGEKLAARNCITVDDLAAYTSVEFCALAKSICDLKHKSRVYQAAIETVIERKLALLIGVNIRHKIKSSGIRITGIAREYSKRGVKRFVCKI